MDRLEEIQDQLAKEKGFESFFAMDSDADFPEMDSIYNNAAILYAEECVKSAMNKTGGSWIKIEKESDIPTKEGWYWVKPHMNSEPVLMDISKTNPFGFNYMKNHCSHFYSKPISKPDPPIV